MLTDVFSFFSFALYFLCLARVSILSCAAPSASSPHRRDCPLSSFLSRATLTQIQTTRIHASSDPIVTLTCSHSINAPPSPSPLSISIPLIQTFYDQVVQILSSLPELVLAELAGFRWACPKEPAMGSSSSPADVLTELSSCNNNSNRGKPEPTRAHVHSAPLRDEPLDPEFVDYAFY